MNIDLNKFTKEELLSMINDGLDHAKAQRLEIERLKEKVKEWQDIATRINEDNNKLNYIIKDAIEYIKNNAMYSEEWNKCCDDLYTKDCDEVLKILQGSDKE